MPLLGANSHLTSVAHAPQRGCEDPTPAPDTDDGVEDLASSQTFSSARLRIDELFAVLSECMTTLERAEKEHESDPWAKKSRMELSKVLNRQLLAIERGSKTFLAACGDFANKKAEERRQHRRDNMLGTNHSTGNGDSIAPNKRHSRSNDKEIFFVEIKDGRVVTLPFPGKGISIATVKRTLSGICNCPPKEQQLRCGAAVLYNDQTLEMAGVRPGSTIRLVLLAETRDALRRYEKRYEIFRDVPGAGSPRARMQKGLEWREALTPVAGISDVKSGSGVGRRNRKGGPGRFRDGSLCLDPRRPSIKIPGNASPIHRKLRKACAEGRRKRAESIRLRTKERERERRIAEERRRKKAERRALDEGLPESPESRSM